MNSILIIILPKRSISDALSMIQWITRSKIGQIAVYNIVTYIIYSLWPCTILSVSPEAFYSASKINLSNEKLLAYKSISLKFCSHSDVVQIIHHRQNLIVFEIQNKQFSSHYPVAAAGCLCSWLHTQTFPRCYTTR